METTATYDNDADEFLINTPTTVAQKYWITNSAVHAKWSAVFAQLLIDGKNHGIHGFLVRIRNEVRRAVLHLTWLVQMAYTQLHLLFPVRPSTSVSVC